MNTRHRRSYQGTLLAILLTLSTLFSSTSRAVSTSTDFSDLWYNANESGWGMNVIHQENILFITLFVYGTGNTPTWFVASNVAFQSQNAAGDRTYRGDLFATTGTPFGVTPFVPLTGANVRTVGTVTFTGLAAGGATLSYTVDGTTVNKTLTRQTWAQPNFTLNVATPYAGATTAEVSGCTNPSQNEKFSSLHPNFAMYINSTGNTMRVEFSESNSTATCTLQGNNYMQEGRYGKATLTGRCTNFPASMSNVTFILSNVEVGANSFSYRYAATGGPLGAGCTERGTTVGAKKVL
jgi:hypothetical protein